ncbi:myosin-binding protein 3-like isoform X1 [Juglans microcarpa x Juglans regia]|uniref:myosin-binding protein 3-like isoform X1 n=1 Tax=Juglans microcarpa x Juglans regia TaxID=2249226 RepID=UPI001B7E6C5B|nr:myosin-binding protein 3-like isoform X1 [Juglans microcarpa x Juglans regia]
METNKFASMLHRNTNNLTLILVYAILEWTLIVLLLLNSLFSYLIIKFADYFGLKRPCLWCSRIDHILEPGKSKNSYRDLVCEAHASEISKLGYCFNHRKLAESHDMCEDCSSSSQPDCPELSKRFAFFPLINKIGFIQSSDQKLGGNEEENLNCSCCGLNVESKVYSPCILIKPSWADFDFSHKENLIAETGVDSQTNECVHSDRSRSNSETSLCEDERSIGGKKEIQIISDFGTDGCSGKREQEAEEKCAVFDFGWKELVAIEDEKLEIVKEKMQELEKEENLIESMDDQSCDQSMAHVNFSKETSHETWPQHLEFFIDGEDCTLIAVELIGSPATEDGDQPRYGVDDQGNCDSDVILEFNMHAEEHAQPLSENWQSSGENLALLSSHESKEAPKVAVVESVVMVETDSSSVMHTEGDFSDLVWEDYKQAAITQPTQTPSSDDDHEEQETAETRKMDSDVPIASEEVIQTQSCEFDAEISRGAEILDQKPLDEAQPQEVHKSCEFDAEISRGAEIPDQEPLDEAQHQEVFPSYKHRQQYPSTSSVILHVYDVNGPKPAEEEVFHFKTISVESNKQAINNHVSVRSEPNEIEEEKVPDTPTSVESLHHLHKKLLLLERKESRTDESLDGSVIGEIEGGELTIEKLESALRAERKALNALYAELEEERSSSAVATNQTMAMINRLQEEKAAMQMEALQYQRMMEEQSEYDQEALQLLNELMVKREKEKQEVEKELGMYRKKVQDYEAKEKMRMLRRTDSSTRSIASCSNAEDSDGLSIDLNHEAKERNSSFGNQESSNQNTPTDAVVYLEESLANFEEERLSIFQQLKELEEKLLTLSDEEEQQFEDLIPVVKGNGYHYNSDADIEANAFENGHSKEVNGKHHQEISIKGSKAKRLLPFFDAIVTDGEDALGNGHEQGFGSVPFQTSLDTKFEMENKLAIKEEVDNVYERLQALEADREFLKHCVSSLSKGDKGLNLLQEILEHLHDLRGVGLRVRKMVDGPLY